jgi:hypothetical protein
MVTSEQAAAALSEPELQASDLVPRKYEGTYIHQSPATPTAALHHQHSLIGSMQIAAKQQQ